MQHFAHAIPGIVINQQELRIDYPNGGQVRIYGSDNEDGLRGIYLDGVVLDEYGLQSPRVFSEVVRPALADRQGSALFIGTPNGKNQFYDIVQQALRGEPGWFYAQYKASETGILSAEELAAARTVMTADEYAQEFECSFRRASGGRSTRRNSRRLGLQVVSVRSLTIRPCPSTRTGISASGTPRRSGFLSHFAPVRFG